MSLNYSTKKKISAKSFNRSQFQTTVYQKPKVKQLKKINIETIKSLKTENSFIKPKKTEEKQITQKEFNLDQFSEEFYKFSGNNKGSTVEIILKNFKLTEISKIIDNLNNQKIELAEKIKFIFEDNNEKENLNQKLTLIVQKIALFELVNDFMNESKSFNQIILNN